MIGANKAMKIMMLLGIMFIAIMSGQVNAASAVQQSQFPVSELDGRVIYFENVTPYRGYYMSAISKEDDKNLPIEETAVMAEVESRATVIDNVRCKWRVSYLGPAEREGHHLIALESMKNRNMYVAKLNQYVGWLGLVESGYPAEDSRVKIMLDPSWDIYTGMLDRVTLNLESLLPGGFIVIDQLPEDYRPPIAHMSYSDEKYPKNGNNLFVYIPETTDDYTTIDTIDNSQHSTPTEWSKTVTVGVSKTSGESISQSLEVAMSLELQAAFTKFSTSLKYGITWQKQTSVTFSRSESKTLKTTIAPGIICDVKQLFGNYGETFEIGADNYKFVDRNTGEEIPHEEFRQGGETEVRLMPLQ